MVESREKRGANGRDHAAAWSFSKIQRGGAAGQSMVEFALTLPVLLLIMLAIFDMGRAVYAQNVLTNAAREGARYLSTQEQPYDIGAFQDRTESLIVGIDASEVGTNFVVNNDLGTVRVTLEYDFTPATPMIARFLGGGGSITFKGVSTMRLEGVE